MDELLGDEGTEVTGVRWDYFGEGGQTALLPVLSETFTEGLLAALRDLRDETVRRLQASGRGPEE